MVSYQKNVGLCVALALSFALGAAEMSSDKAVVPACQQTGIIQTIEDDIKRGITPLHRMAQQDNVELLLHLLRQDNNDLLSQKDADGKTALDYAREAKKDNMIDILTRWPHFKQQAFNNCEVAKWTNAFLTGLHERCGAKSTVITLPVFTAQEICRYAMHHVVTKPDFKLDLSTKAFFLCENYYQNLLCQAAATGNGKDLRFALKCGAWGREEQSWSEGMIDKTALYQAVSHHHYDLIPALCESAIDARRNLAVFFHRCFQQSIPDVKDIVEKVTEKYEMLRCRHQDAERIGPFTLPALFAQVVARGDSAFFDFLVKKWNEQNKTGDPDDKKLFLKNVVYQYFHFKPADRKDSLKVFEKLLLLCSLAGIDKKDNATYFYRAAIDEKNYELLQLLLKYGFDIQKTDGPLAIACEHDDWQAAKKLLENGASACIFRRLRPHNETCFEYFYENQQFQLMQIALEKWSDFSVDAIRAIKRVLRKAIENNDLKNVEMLLACGRKRAQQRGNVLIGHDDLVNAAFSQNSAQDNLKMVELLLRYGADPSEGEGSLLKILSLCCTPATKDCPHQSGDDQIVELVVKHLAASKGQADKDIHKLLMSAIFRNDLKKCELIWSYLGCFMPRKEHLYPENRNYDLKLSPELEALWQKIQRIHEDRKLAKKAFEALFAGFQERSGAQSDLSRLGVPVEMAQKICSWVIPGKTCDDWKKPAIGQQAPAAPVVPGLAPNGAGNASMWAIFGRLAHAFNRHRATAAVHGFCSAVTRGIGVLGRCLPLVNRMVRLLL